MDGETGVEESDRIRYAGQLERIKLRIDEADRIRKEIRDERGVVYAAAQLRLALEEIAYASLVGNRSAMEQAERSLLVSGWDKASKSLKAINPDYWPRGISEFPGEDGNPSKWLDVTDGLSESDVARAWGRLSQILHARNPWHVSSDFKAESTFISDLIGKLRKTLSSHLIKLVGGEHLLFCQVGASPVRVYIFGRVDTDPVLETMPDDSDTSPERPSDAASLASRSW